MFKVDNKTLKLNVFIFFVHKVLFLCTTKFLGICFLLTDSLPRTLRVLLSTLSSL